MKKILFAAFAATLLAAGCQKTEIVGTTPVNGPAMTFSTEMKKITKADDNQQNPTTPPTTTDGDLKLQNQGFKVWAYADFTTDNTTNVDDETLIYDGMKFMHITYDNGWKTPNNTQYYWPGTDKHLRFFAISSSSLTEDKITVTHGIGSDVQPKIVIQGFNVTGNATEDLMVADFRRQDQADDDRVVNLNFRHTLSKVEFKFKTTAIGGEVPTVFVQKLEVSDLCSTADLTVESKESYNTELLNNEVEFAWSNTTKATDPFTATWSTLAADFPEEFTPVTGESNGEGANKALKLTETAQTFVTWLMLPDKSISGKKVTITYVIGNRQFKNSFELGGKKTGDAYQLASWEVNQYITYTVDLSPNMISFNASSTDWTTPHTDVGMNN